MSTVVAFGTSLLFHFMDYFSEKQYQQQTKLKGKKNPQEFQNDAVSIRKTGQHLKALINTIMHLSLGL